VSVTAPSPAAVAADCVDPFASVFGNQRGCGRAPGVLTLQHILYNEGYDEALRVFAGRRSSLATQPQQIDLLSAHALDLSYERARPQLLSWLRSVSVRSRFMSDLLFDSSERGHYLHRGHLFADVHDLVKSSRRPIAFDCGTRERAPSALERGAWALVLESRDPFREHLCSICAKIASQHPETQKRDKYDPLPAPTLECALTLWRAQLTPTLHELLCNEGVGFDTLMAASVPALDELAIRWAARAIHRHPRAHALRGLRADKTILGGGEAFVYAERIADCALSEDAWAEMLREHKRVYYPFADNGASADSVWAEMLMKVSSKHV
jgi:hypothetical protein